jgi:hypothetical protein
MQNLWKSDNSNVGLANAQVTFLAGATISKIDALIGPYSSIYSNMHGNRDDRGINMIFSDRAETSIKHSSPVPSGSGRGQSREFPDRVIGLTETENFRALLNSYDNRTIAGNEWKRLRETIKYSPFVSEVKPLLFPFLIVEAKSSKSGFNFHAIGSQTMFCIKNFLELQMNLRLATGKGSFEPLVWFVCYAGQFWNISACYVQKSASDELEFVCE